MTVCLSLWSPFVSLSSVCDDYTAVENMSFSTDTQVGSRSFNLPQVEMSDLVVVLEVNITLHGNWTHHSLMNTAGMLGNTPKHTTVDKQVAVTSLLLSDITDNLKTHCVV